MIGRYTLVAVAAVFIIIAACAGALWLVNATGQSLITRLERDSATIEIDLYAELRREEGPAALVRAVARHVRVAGEHHVVAVADHNGRLLAGNLSFWPQLPAGDIAWTPLPT